ncbi:phosphatase PAP2 family protein [Niabella sp. CC-SYL272]|uniref:phosphatase PAP2 family protein n=1 Tax=Niabella agricola TaxID=2891571 RepID=UPI001F2E01DF|nr:phosphatase PAP2 family protein [Niabella agricola]MCF3107505.1 phosphatase PAP2 family protein [Niabella agricola]
MNHLHLKTRFQLLFLLLITGSCLAQKPADSTLRRGYALKPQCFHSRKITGRSYILPAALVAYGTIATIARVQKTERFVDEPRISLKETSALLEPENYTAFAPAAAVFGLQVMGVKGIHKPQEQALLLALSAGISSSLVYPLKNNTRVVRPDKSDAHSFPSGHTALAFATAEFLRREYGHRSAWYTIAGYSAATATAALRVTKNKHWLADAGTGAGIGIAATTTAYWVYKKFKKQERSDRANAIFFVPAVSGNYYGVQLLKLL